MKSILTIGAIFLAALTSLVAKPEHRVIEARTLCYAKAATSSKLHTMSKRGDLEILTPQESFSPRFQCALANNKATLFTKDGTDAKGKPIKKIVAVATVPKNIQKALFYLIPNKSNPELLYDIKVLPDDFNGFPLGSTRILNFTKSPARFVVGEHKCQLKQHAIKTLPAVTKRNAFNMAALRYAQLDKKKNWRTMRDTTIRFTDNQRLLIISCFDPRSRRPSIRVYKDFAPPKKARNL